MLKFKKNIVDFFFILLLLEIFLLGSGQAISINGFSLRMLFYFTSILASIVFLLNHSKLPKEVVYFLFLFISMLIISSFIGVINDTNILKLSNNLKQLIYFFMLIPFSLFIKNWNRVRLIGYLIKLSGLFMCIVFLILLALLNFGYIQFDSIYALLSSESNDFMLTQISGEIPRLFYKGFLYLCIAFIFYFYSSYKYKYVVLIILSVAIILTFTRGFLLGLVLSFIFFSLTEIRKKKYFFILLTLFISIPILLPIYIDIIGDRSTSDLDRIIQIQQVFDSITSLSFFIGHGYGIGVPIRPENMEISYLEIFHKQGIMGLFFWIGLLIYIIYKYCNIKCLTYKKIVAPFVTSTFFVYFQSMTNPYINNPIGMSMILLTFSVLIFIVNKDKRSL